ncbi:ribosome assembly factor SBDS [archaeon]|nr:ribosome assembly factor SBDS [archaeon]|tara:strand:+ start:1044 stop:1709 length:666 start_codon:yes stop_codon:yes gene_type:complete
MSTITARFKGFEILVDQDKALAFLQGKPIDIISIVATDTIYTNLQKGTRASETDLKKAFNTTDFTTICEQIIKDGEVMLDTTKRRELLDEKLKQIISEIAQNAVNPKTGIVHPPQRIESALKEAKIKIDPNKPISIQIKEIIPKINHIMPISMQTVQVSITLNPTCVGKGLAIVSKYKVIEKSFTQTGQCTLKVQVSGLQKEQLKNDLHKSCGTDFELIDS